MIEAIRTQRLVVWNSFEICGKENIGHPVTQGEKVGTERAMPRLYFGTPNASIVLRNTKSLDCTSRELLGHNTLTFTQVKSQFPLQAHNFSDGTLPDPTPNVPVCPSQAHTIEWQRNFA